MRPLTQEEAWAQYVGTLSRDAASDTVAWLAKMRHTRSTHFNGEAAEFIIFVESKGRDVLPMPNAGNVGF